MKIGITGHQNLGGAEVIDWLRQELSKIVRRDMVGQAYSSLAIGADQLFAEVCLENGIETIAVIPCAGYEKTFSSQHLVAFDRLLSKVKKIIYLDYPTPSEEAFLNAGQYIVDCIDTICAVWDGEPAKGSGGTADIVNYAESKNKTIIHFNPKTYQINYYGK